MAKKSAKKKSNGPVRILHVRVELQDIEPMIWRGLHVRSDFTLRQMHVAIQVFMPWQNCHLHQFVVGPQGHVYSPKFEDLPRKGSDVSLTVGEVLAGPDSILEYHYDFGDDWRHRIRLVEEVEKVPRRQYPYLVDGERSAPPEDCGGPFGYQDMLEVLSDPSDPEYERTLEWAGQLKPDYFCPEAMRPNWRGRSHWGFR